jgi:hypothetical protein
MHEQELGCLRIDLLIVCSNEILFGDFAEIDGGS